MYRVIENRQCNAHEPLTRKRINYTMTIGINFSIRVTVFIEKLHECVFFRVIVFHRKSYTNQKNANYTRKRATLVYINDIISYGLSSICITQSSLSTGYVRKLTFVTFMIISLSILILVYPCTGRTLSIWACVHFQKCSFFIKRKT